MRKSSVATALVLSCALLLGGSTVCHAQQDQSLAQGLFEEAMALMNEGRFSEACPKLAESHRLEPGGGTIFNLAICFEKEGKPASAYVAYDEALARAVKDLNRERETAARERLAQLKPTLSKLVVRVHPATSKLDALDVRFDGAQLRPEAWGIRVPVDPGAHTLTAAAPNHVDFRQEMSVTEPGKVYELDVPELDALAAPSTAAKPPTNDLVVAAPSSKRPTLAYVLLATGGVFVVAGGVSGALALSNHNTSNDACPNGPTSCTSAGVRAEEAAERFSWGANIGIGLGLIAVGVGAYLLLTTPPTSRPRALALTF